jgi:ketosteroid isomerase-like protein
MLATLELVGCASTATRDLAHYPFPEDQAKIREVIQTLTDDAIGGDAEGIRAAHLYSDKFTKFPGGKYERIGFDECVDEEISVFTSAQELKMDADGIKIDVFGDVAVLTEYFHLSHTVDDEPETINARVTLVFLKTVTGWKIVHEHVTGKEFFE